MIQSDMTQPEIGIFRRLQVHSHFCNPTWTS